MHNLVANTPWNNPWQQKINLKTEQLKNNHQNLNKNIPWPNLTLKCHHRHQQKNSLDSYDTIVYFNLTVCLGSRSRRSFTYTHITYQTNRQTDTFVN